MDERCASPGNCSVTWTGLVVEEAERGPRIQVPQIRSITKTKPFVSEVPVPEGRTRRVWLLE
jgi:hypothetical protein